MFYIFAYLSAFLPTMLLQSSVLDTSLAPTTGALSICLLGVCAVFQWRGTTAHDYIEDIHNPNISSINDPPWTETPIHDQVGGGDGDSECWQCEERKGCRHAQSLFIAPTLHSPNIEPFAWDILQGDIRSPALSFPHRKFPRVVYPLRKLDTAVAPAAEYSSSNFTLPFGLWPDRDRLLALMYSGGFGRNISTFRWGFVNDTMEDDPPRLPIVSTPHTSQESHVKPLDPSLTVREPRGTVKHVAINPKSIPPDLALHEGIPPSQRWYFAFNRGLVRNPSVFSWGIRFLGRLLQWSLGYGEFVSKRKAITNNTDDHWKWHYRTPLTLPPVTRVLVKTSRPALPQCPASSATRWLSNDTCLDVYIDKTDGLIQDLPRPTVEKDRILPRSFKYHWSDEVSGRTRSSPRLFEPPGFSETSFRPVSTSLLPCLDVDNRGVPKNCGFHVSPTLAIALNWDIKSQAALLAPTEVPRLAMVMRPEPPICHRRRGSYLGTNPCETPPSIPLPPRPSTLFFNSRLRFIYITAISLTLAVLARSLWLAKETGWSEKSIALVIILASLGGAYFDRGPPKEDPPVGVKIGEMPAEVTTTGPVDIVNTAEQEIPPEIDTALNIPTLSVPKSKPSPVRGKARIVAGRRVRPVRKTSSASSISAQEGTSPTETSPKKNTSFKWVRRP